MKVRCQVQPGMTLYRVLEHFAEHEDLSFSVTELADLFGMHRGLISQKVCKLHRIYNFVYIAEYARNCGQPTPFYRFGPGMRDVKAPEPYSNAVAQREYRRRKLRKAPSIFALGAIIATREAAFNRMKEKRNGTKATERR